jgi:dinuclear metal center YbgI/SA1388 family protein
MKEAITLRELDRWFQSILPIEDLAGIDYSLNGVQIGRMEKEIEKVAFAVDACLETITRAGEAGADLLFVHHGLFWGKPEAITGTHYRRVRKLIEDDTVLYAAHLPLDMQKEFGNNAGLSRRLGLVEIEPFGRYRNIQIGYSGRLPEPLDMNGILERLALAREDALGILTFGPKEISTVAVISGGADKEVGQAIDAGVDLYITGELSHQVYHTCMEGGINLIAAGHYWSEMVGVQLLSQKLNREKGIETLFIDLPTGL